MHDLDTFVRQSLLPQGYVNPVVVALTQTTTITHTIAYSGPQRTLTNCPHETTWRIEVINEDGTQCKHLVLLASVNLDQHGALTLLSQEDLQ
jgi:hypothetical protein